jgi:hypothetical protein
MAVEHLSLGDFRKGDRVQFAIDNVGGGFTGATYDVIDNSTRLEAQTNVAIDDGVTDSPADLLWVDIELADDFDTDGTRVFTWVEGQAYTIRITPTAGDNIIATFRVDPGEKRAFLGVVEKGKNLYFVHREERHDNLWYDVYDPRDGTKVFANVAMTAPLANLGGGRYFAGEIETEGTDDLAVGRTYWVRVKDMPVEDPNLDWLYSFTVLPRLEAELARLLAYSGENIVLDSFGYDQAGNVLGLRVRAFENADDADNATAGVTDPEPGEIAALRVTQEHNVPRNVRTFHKSVLEFISSTFPKET